MKKHHTMSAEHSFYCLPVSAPPKAGELVQDSICQQTGKAYFWHGLYLVYEVMIKKYSVS